MAKQYSEGNDFISRNWSVWAAIVLNDAREIILKQTLEINHGGRVIVTWSALALRLKKHYLLTSQGPTG